MLSNSKDSSNQIFSDIKHEIHRGALDKRHPFRECILNTFGKQFPASRYVILRKVDNDLNCYIYTDKRSEKVEQIKANEAANMLLYHPSKKCQIRIDAYAEILKNIEEDWLSISSHGRKSYTSVYPPGKRIITPEKAWKWDENEAPENFLKIKLIPKRIELLQLSGNKHFRIEFHREGEEWKGHWLVP